MRTTKFRGMANARARIIVAALALLSCLWLFGGALADSDGMLRVKLARLGSPASITMRADCEYALTDPERRFPAGTELTLTAANGELTLTVDGSATVLGPAAQFTRAEAGSVGMQFISPALSNRFCGDLAFTASGSAITTVLCVYVEDYLYGVVGYELAPSSGLEALKAQAIVARNYALRQKSARANAAYDLVDLGDALSYRGYNSAAEYADVLRAVDDTRGQILTWDGNPATCYFCESNGGQIESAENALGEPLPYSLLRDDPYDLDAAGAKKTASLRRDATELAPELEQALTQAAAKSLALMGFGGDAAGVHIESIDAVEPGPARYPAPSRLYASLVFHLSVTAQDTDGERRKAQAEVEIPTYGALEAWYDLSINDADNETVWITETDRTFEITFRRSGTGLGMSRRGAQVMARKGFSCEEILEYYYPGCETERLSLADAARDGATAAKAPRSEPIATARLSQKTRVYQSADESVAAITTLPAGATVDIYAVQGDWAALGSGGVYGFAHTDALTDFALLGATAAQVKNETLARVGAGVDVLQLPVAEARAMERVNGGDVVRLNGYTDDWALVTTQSGVEGFIPRAALTLQAETGDDGEIVTAPDDLAALVTEDAGLYVNADDTVAPRQTLEKGGYVQILAYNRAWAFVRTQDGLSGYVKLSGLSPVEAQQQEEVAEADAEADNVTIVEGVAYRYVSADALPMFEQPASDSAVLATLSAGEQVRLGAYTDEWACVRADGATGFVLLSGLTEQAPEPAEKPIEGGEVTRVQGEQFAAVQLDDAPLYAGPDASQAPLVHLSQGDRVQLGAYNQRWACVRVSGITGFMPLEALDMDPAEETPARDDINYVECEAEATARLELYPRSNLSGEAMAEVNKGARLHVYAFNRSVAYVEYDGVRGFAAIEKLSKID